MPSLLGAAAAATEREGAAFAVQLGDLANAPFRDRPTQERALREAYEAVASRLPVPLFPVIGNHESYGADAYPAWRAAMGPVLSSLFGASRRGDALWARREGDVLLVALDSNVDCAPETRLAFVRDALAANPDARHVFILGHAPLLPSPTGQEGYPRPFPFDPFGELMRLLQSRGATYLCGDLHTLSCERVADRSGAFSQLCLSSVCTPDKLAFRDGAAYPATDAERAGALRDPDPLADGAVRVLRYRTPAPGAAQDVAALAAEDATASWRFDPATETLRLDLRLAWRAVAPASAPFEPASGAILGFDAAWRDRPLLGAEVKVHDRPSVWACVRFGRSEPD